MKTRMIYINRSLNFSLKVIIFSSLFVVFLTSSGCDACDPIKPPPPTPEPDCWGYLSLNLIPDVKSIAATGDSVYVGGDNGAILRLSTSGVGISIVNRSIMASNYSGSGTPYTETVTCVALLGASLYAGTSGGGLYLGNPNNAGPWSSCSFAALSGSNVVDMASDAQGKHFAVSNHGIYRSTDQGFTWSLMYQTSDALSCIAVDPSHNALYVGFNYGVLKSVDDGSTWTNITSNSVQLYNTVDLAISNTGSGPMIYALTLFTLYTSSDNGDTWVETSNTITFPPNHAFTSLAVRTFAGGDDVYIGSSTTGITFRSFSSSSDWTTDNNSHGLSTSNVKFCVIRQNDVVYLGASNGAYQQIN